ncbi:MAG: DUF1501 domain-containing protein [Planctomycetota bacterium]
MNEFAETNHAEISRRLFFGRSGLGLGTAALAGLLQRDGVLAAAPGTESTGAVLSDAQTHARPKARRVIYLCQSGGPAQMDLFDYKPRMRQMFNVDLPASVIGKQRLTTMTSGQKRFPVAPSAFEFRRHGSSGAWLSELMPHTAGIADRVCFVKSMYTEAINHDPAITFLQTGSERSGRPSMGAWLSYGLGSLNEDLPSFVVMTSATKNDGQPLYNRLWGSGFLPSEYQGVRLRGVGAPVPYLDDPPGVSRSTRRRIINDVAKLDRLSAGVLGDAQVQERIARYELASGMQSSVPEIVDTKDEPAQTWKLYGEAAKQRGSYASQCLLARRLLEKGVRFVQLFHRGNGIA